MQKRMLAEYDEDNKGESDDESEVKSIIRVIIEY